MLRHPAAREALLEFGTTPAQLLAAGFLNDAPFEPWRDLIGEPAQLDAGRAALAGQLIEQAAAARRAWYDAAAAAALARLARDGQTAAEAQAELARARRDAGNLSRLETAELLAEAAEARRDALAEQAEAEQALATLRQALGQAPDARPTLGELPAPPTGAPRFDGLEALAQQRRPALRQTLAMAAIDSGVAQQTALRSATPALPLLGSGNVLGHRDNRLGDRLALDAQLHALRGELAVREAALRQAQQQWRIAATEIVPARAEARVEALKHYNGMLRGVDALLQSRAAELRARGDEIRARRDYWRAWLALEAAAGGALPAPRIEASAEAAPPAPAADTPQHHAMTH
ncbi:TolC family protein [Chitinimonas koreensis]|uniref:TolC family protein n=1 Tax=Chitinimonas koreensis TaxID=356302 RepID=UPI0016542660|nr:hypothetical protein [Chitinimonas koreensis]QNM98038.1 hypothetical protein H9L41_07200 [Chitinimonas koreensis]